MLEVQNINFKYPSSEIIFSDLSFDLPNTSLIHLKGTNGCGKTTLLKILSHLIIPNSGKITFSKKVLSESDVAYMPSQPESSFVQLTGKETLDLFSRLNKSASISESYLEHLSKIETFQKALETKFAFCSTGMKQIINFARVLSKNAPILLLDEPFHGLDTETKEKLAPLFEELKEKSLILLTSHEDPFLNVDKTLILQGGRITGA